MRKKRAIIVDDEAVVLNLLKMFLELRKYEVIACREAFSCTIYGDHTKCDNLQPCTDVLITDNRMPKMSGIEMLEAQERMGCKLIPGNKVVISGFLDECEFKKIGELGCAFLQKPFTPEEMEAWLVGCEERMDLTKPLGSRRKEQRETCSLGVSYRKEAADPVFAATTINRSGSGLCLKVDQAPVLHDVLTLMADLHDLQLPSKKAEVRWSAPAGDGGYYVGLSCC
jgi:DNA-binding NtrC family response regulator